MEKRKGFITAWRNYWRRKREIISDSDKCPHCSGQVIIRTRLSVPFPYMGRCVLIDLECQACEWTRQKLIQLSHMLLPKQAEIVEGEGR